MFMVKMNKKELKKMKMEKYYSCFLNYKYATVFCVENKNKIQLEEEYEKAGFNKYNEPYYRKDFEKSSFVPDFLQKYYIRCIIQKDFSMDNSVRFYRRYPDKKIVFIPNIQDFRK